MNEGQGFEIVIAEIQKNTRERIRISLSSFEGSPTISVWRFYVAASGEVRPGKGGLVLGIRHLPALADALAQAVAAARAEGRLPLA